VKVLDSVLFYSRDGNNWLHGNKNIYQYNEQALRTLLEEFSFDFEDNLWKKDYVRQTYYDDQNRISEEVYQSYDFDTETLINQDRNTYEYDGDLVIKDFSYDWDIFLNMWVYHRYYFYEYDTEGKTQKRTSYLWENNGWVMESRRTYTYDGNGNQEENLDEGWDSSTSQWIYSGRTIYSYNNNGGLLTLTRQNWDGTAWNTIYEFTFTYDASSHLISFEALFLFNGSVINHILIKSAYQGGTVVADTTLEKNLLTGQWHYADLRSYETDADGDLTLATASVWDEGTGSWQLSGREEYYYSLIALSNSVESSGASASIRCLFPNPLPSGQAITCFDLKANESYTLRLFDSTGRLRYSHLFSGVESTSQLDAPKGFYFLTVSDGAGIVYREKVVVP
jgi:hypothetical protein